ncbi:acyl-ACP desaturase [Gordonia sp. PS3]|uniref:Acyl-[acyl-carrier-protein] desaturase DesA n=1 Tax=Gordonia sihwensis NBRC 108236 TaxID=1223544 RepID=L7LPF4_9ACTN|nr:MULTISPECIES: acyl-ACP desaturase [Gordonia]AUH70454.1 fatty acid desaturase [Gordonia sp. YC-JH1]KXT57471.1 fatty acid desaturase [Gordonia sp. QH-12]WFN93776.1 acyl-ACP desaturase [Gordonia sihwensis]GAC62621.1 acyl-[acyl-carrier-protein] desaturase DesA [Gordonia sihwensis NBRC 108236]
MAVLSNDELINALEKALPEIAEEHAEGAISWTPSDWIPWDLGRNFAFLGGDDYVPSDSTLPETAAAGLQALLLTKDNLPSFHRVLAMHFPAFSDWRQLVGVWTAEDNRHSIVLRDYLVVTRAVDPVEAENRRRIHVVAGWRQSPEAIENLGPMDVLALLAVHENQCVTFIEKLLGYVDDENLTQILTKIQTDDAVQAATFQAFLMAGVVADQESTVLAVDKALAGIEHIGSDIADFDAQRDFISDFEDVSTDAAIAAKLASELKLESLQELSAEAESARARILAKAAGH